MYIKYSVSIHITRPRRLKWIEKAPCAQRGPLETPLETCWAKEGLSRLRSRPLRLEPRSLRNPEGSKGTSTGSHSGPSEPAEDATGSPQTSKHIENLRKNNVFSTPHFRVTGPHFGLRGTPERPLGPLRGPARTPGGTRRTPGGPRRSPGGAGRTPGGPKRSPGGAWEAPRDPFGDPRGPQGGTGRPQGANKCQNRTRTHAKS